MTAMLLLTDLIAAGALAGKRVFIRADLNAPRDAAGHIIDDARLRASLPAMRAALAAGAAVMVTSHLGRPAEGVLRPEDSLSAVAVRLGELLGFAVPLVRNWVENGVNVMPAQLVLLENCRVNSGEKADSDALARKMAALCDIYVNDAFGAAHRAEASTHGIAQYARLACAGPLLAAELEALARALDTPKRPLIAIVGGAKVSTKLTVLQSLAERVDQLIVGGGIANTFMLAAGLRIGRSLAEPELVEQARAIIAAMQRRGAAVPIPLDVVTAKKLDQLDPGARAETKPAAAVADDDLILDLGPVTARQLAEQLAQAGTIVWNGPVGVFEYAPFSAGTETLAAAIAAAAAFSLAGGGDTLAAIAKYKIADKIGYISTGGGAFLEFLAGRALPAVEVLKARADAHSTGNNF